MRALNLAFLLLIAATAPSPELASATRTRAALAEKLAAREHDLKTRVRALYKLSRAGELPLWVDDEARRLEVHARGAALRMLLRDLDERRLLRAELAAAVDDEARLRDEPPAARPASTLVRPVAGAIVHRFGVYPDAETGAKLPRRGLELAATPGMPVLAVAGGSVLYVGPVRGLGATVIVEHDGFVSVLARLAGAAVAPGQRLVPAMPVGVAGSQPIYLEVRVAGRPVDPRPLFHAEP